LKYFLGKDGSSFLEKSAQCACAYFSQKYIGADTLKELFENANSRNFIAFI